MDIGFGTGSIHAGFQEVRGLGMEIANGPYAREKFKDKSPFKETATYKVQDISLKRGIILSGNFYRWVGQMQGGNMEDQPCWVEIHLLGQDGKTTITGWVLINARPIKYAGPVQFANGTGPAVEELVLCCDSIELIA